MSKYGGYEEHPLIAELYDFVPLCAGRKDVEFYLDFSRAAVGKILELGCGTGRVLVPTARAGFEITGIDVSEYMLTQCRTKLERESLEVQERVRLVHGDIADFDLNDRFSLVTTPFRSFQHLLSLDEQMACLQCANRHMEMKGKLILDLFHADFRFLANSDNEREREDFPEVQLPDGRKMRRTGRVVAFHRAHQYNDIEMTYHIVHPDGRVEKVVQSFPLRYFFRYEIEHLLARCGFRIEEFFGDFDKSALKDNSPEMIFVASKVKD